MDTQSNARWRVVIVDDQADIRLLLATRLSLVPQVVVVGEAADGNEAIEITRQLRPDAMILDLHMPGLSGTRAIPTLRRLQPRMRILVYSAQSDLHQLEGETKPDASLVKGVELRILVETLLQLLGETPRDFVPAPVP